MSLKKIKILLLSSCCLLIPILVSISISGCLQTMQLNKPRLMGDTGVIAGSYDEEDSSRISLLNGRTSISLKMFVLILCLGFLIIIILGVVSAYKFNQRQLLVWLSFSLWSQTLTFLS